MQKNIILLVLSGAILALSAFKVISAENATAQTSAKSVAWYVANIQAARTTNQQCHDSPNMQSSEDCQNALHALEISFKGGN